MCRNRMTLLTLDVTEVNKVSRKERYALRFVRLAKPNFNFDGNCISIQLFVLLLSLLLTIMRTKICCTKRDTKNVVLE